MGSVQFGIPRELALALKAKHGLVDFVETGTLVGDTAEWASDHFEYVFTVDVDAERRESVLARFSGRRNVWCLLCDSVAFMQDTPLARPTLIWLDAHTNESCPVLSEIAAINKSPLNYVNHVILVDDYRLFGDLSAWPSVDEVSRALHDGGRRTVTVFEDVFVAEPV